MRKLGQITNLNVPWSEEEEKLLIKAYLIHGIHNKMLPTIVTTKNKP